MTPETHPRPSGRLLAFIQHEATAGAILVFAALGAIVAYNIDSLRPLYDGFLQARATVAVADLGVSKPLLLWINDGLMAIFFFLVGLEIKRELLEGNLAARDQIILPAAGAVGGMVMPALVFTYFNSGDSELMRGWAIPAATDIAFALAALSIAGKRVPVALKVFLLTLATLDDLGAIVIIAIFYTSDLSLLSLGLAAVAILVALGFNRRHVDRTAPYVLVGLALWVFVLKSGVHATLAGVAIGLLIPLHRRDGSPFVHHLEEALHPYVKFLILPLFAFANAGIPLDGFGLARLTEPLPAGIAAGLVVGKPVGILLVILAVTALRLAKLPDGCNWRQMAGVACLAGVGFTMSLFIGSLAFSAAELQTSVRVGVIVGSVVSSILGVVILLLPGASKPESESDG